MNNYEYCADWAKRHCPPGGKILDYGCGAGQIVTLLRAKGFNAFGCDLYYGGGDWSGNIPPETRPYVSRMEGDRIPFDDGSFDLLISNQVLEHVPNLEIVSREMARALKPGGRSLHLFPDKTVWREGHCEVPFLHWFPKGSSLRVYYAAMVRALGFGALHKGKPVMQWSRDFCDWLDQWTYYRSRAEIHATFARHFASLSHIEVEWFSARRSTPLPDFMKRFIALKMANMVIELQK